MKWKKVKQLFAPDNNFPWMASHAANPFAEQVDGSVYTVYFTSRDRFSRSHICSLKLDMDALQVIEVGSRPVLLPGEAGLFDDSGVALGCVVNIRGRKCLYYLGWNLAVTVPWRNTIGMAVYDEETGEFKKYSRAPLLDRSEEDPFSISYPWIIEENGIFKMWYGSNLKWGSDQSAMHHVIKYAWSRDGILWQRTKDIAVGLIHPGEYALSKPVVLKDKDGYSMWYSYRGCNDITTYRIGYAESSDGNKWRRVDNKAGIDVSVSGWDSEMICYPFIFSHRNSKFMLYNGNGYGRTGFGIAVLE